MFERIKNFFLGTPDHTNEFFAGDITAHKGAAGIAYIFFFVPLITDASSGYAKFHANQGLLLLIAWIAANLAAAVLRLFPFIGLLLSFIAGAVLNIALLAMLILGMINGFNGRAKELPFIGGFRIIK